MYIVIELQTASDGSLANIVTEYSTIPEAESKYHTIMAAAALSSVPIHAAVILDEDGKELVHGSYHH